MKTFIWYCPVIVLLYRLAGGSLLNSESDSDADSSSSSLDDYAPMSPGNDDPTQITLRLGEEHRSLHKSRFKLTGRQQTVNINIIPTQPGHQGDAEIWIHFPLMNYGFDINVHLDIGSVEPTKYTLMPIRKRAREYHDAEAVADRNRVPLWPEGDANQIYEFMYKIPAAPFTMILKISGISKKFERWYKGEIVEIQVNTNPAGAASTAQYVKGVLGQYDLEEAERNRWQGGPSRSPRF